MVAAMEAMTSRTIVSNILEQLSDMKYKDRRQYGPDQPVEFLEFRPTLVPSILVNRLWADEGTSILWKRYPHLPALKAMEPTRRQYYANKIQRIFTMGPPPEGSQSLDYLDDLTWPSLKSLELEVDLQRYGAKFSSMLHPGLEHLEISGVQSGAPAYFADVVFPSLLGPCQNLKSIRFAPETTTNHDRLDTSDLMAFLDTTPSITSVAVKTTNLSGKDFLFTQLSQRTGLEGLEIDLDPRITLLPQLSGPNALSSPFSSLKRLAIMCYPEIALALPRHLYLIEDLQIEICRIPDQPAQSSDSIIIEALIAELSHCPNLRLLKIGLGAIAVDFPSLRSLPRLGGGALVNLSSVCPKLEDINIFCTEPSALDGSDISVNHFESFCQNLPHLKNLSLKLHPTTAPALADTALQSLGQHCKELELLRIKLPFQLQNLPVSNAVPQIQVQDVSASNLNLPDQKDESEAGKIPSPNSGGSSSSISPSSVTDVSPLFPLLVHLAISRPETLLSAVNDNLTTSTASIEGTSSDIVDHEVEEELVRTWAHALITHFPRLEILEAWGDWTGQDNESLNYFLPTEEILASTWEFLNGTEQDLWDDAEEDEEGDMEEEEENWVSYESGTDWDAASYVEELELIGIDEKLRGYEEEPDGMITPGRLRETQFFEHPGIPYNEPPIEISYVEGLDLATAPSPPVPTNGIADLRIS